MAPGLTGSELKRFADIGISRTIRLGFDSELEEEVDVEEIAPGQFRLLFTPITMLPYVWLGDVIEAQADEQGVFWVQRLVEPSPFRHYDWLLAQEIMESEELAAFTVRVSQSGGEWERFFGGCLLVHVPADAAFDAEKELSGVIARMRERMTDVA